MKRQIQVSHIVEVEVDEAKFTPEFMAEFRENFFNFTTIEDHITHIGQLYARGIIDGHLKEFIEGYRPANEMGIRMCSVGGGFDVDLLPSATVS